MGGRRHKVRRGGERVQGGEKGKEGESKGEGGKKISVFLSDVLGFQLLKG